MTFACLMLFQKQMTKAKFCSVGLQCALYQFSKYVFTFLTAFPIQRCIHWHLVLVFAHDVMAVKMKESDLFFSVLMSKVSLELCGQINSILHCHNL